LPWALELKLELGLVWELALASAWVPPLALGQVLALPWVLESGWLAEGLVFWLPVAGQWDGPWEILELSVVLAY
jgi:hypothetical protein